MTLIGYENIVHRTRNLGFERHKCTYDLVFTFQEPKVYVQALLEVYNKYYSMVTSSFNEDSGFLQALDKVMPWINI